jgi:hypothetical protein
VDFGHLLLLLQRKIAPVWHHTMPGEGGIHLISSESQVDQADDIGHREGFAAESG